MTFLSPTTRLGPPLLLAFAIVASAAGNARAEREGKGRLPNILVIVADDMGYGDPGCFNPESRIATPHIDALAASGMKFTDAHAPGPLCHLSRYGLLTGEYPFRTDVTRWPTEPVVREGQETIATVARHAGYQTSMVGKWHLGFDEKGYDNPLRGGPIDRGFDTFFGMRASTDIPPYFYIRGDQAVEQPTASIDDDFSYDWSRIQGRRRLAGKIAPGMKLEEVLPRFTDESIRVLERHAGDKEGRPFLHYLAYPAPHTPWLPSEEHRGASGAGLYGDFAQMVDAEIGRVVAALKNAGVWDETLIVFTSDNGPCWYDDDVANFGHDSAGGLRGMKGDAWEAGHRMPFIVTWPGVVQSGSTSGKTICFTDLLATFADILGQPLEDRIAPDSYSFLPELIGVQPEDKALRPPVVTQAGSAPEMFAIRHERWKLINGLGSGGFSKPKRIKATENGPAGQLYDLESDPGEQQNLYEEHPNVVAGALRVLKRTRKAPIARTALRPSDAVDTDTLHGKVMCGYQGWFNVPDDGMRLGWKHWARTSKKPFGPGNATIDLWPDVSELNEEERYATDFRLAGGETAEVYSSVNPKTIRRHFEWMREYGIDGAFLQRFANGLTNDKILKNKNQVLTGVRSAAAATGRAYVVMYDLSGLKAGQTQRVLDDWRELRDRRRVTSDASYLSHKGKPLVAIWGVGFSDGSKPREYTLDECRRLITEIKASGCSVMLGVPSGWRTLTRDAMRDERLHEVIEMADVISPWTPGRYRNRDQVLTHAKERWTPDGEWCSERGVDYLPVVFPGFSWHNLTGDPLDDIPREGGRFLWSQFVAAKRSGAKMIYVAMFDEVDEGTAIFKCTNEPPVGENVRFLTYEGLPSDHYLWLTGEAGRMLRGERPATRVLPRREP